MNSKAPVEPMKIDAGEESPAREIASNVDGDDKHKAEKLTGEHEAYEPEGGDS